jgi:hypothetical protein
MRQQNCRPSCKQLLQYRLACNNRDLPVPRQNNNREARLLRLTRPSNNRHLCRLPRPSNCLGLAPVRRRQSELDT